jgi:bifunctional non-homologous end joining protein LigD
MNERRFASRIAKLTKPDKVLFPDDGIRKKDVSDYYERVAEVMLPHMQNRPLMLHRFPNGITGPGFFQKNVSRFFPDWIETVSVKKAGGKVTHLVCNDVETLVYLANLACITPHIWLSRTPELSNPDLLIFDLDPADDDFGVVRRTALELRDILRSLGLNCFPMTTGSRGLHVSVVLNRQLGFDDVRTFARSVAELLVQRSPDRITTASRKNKRQGRLLIDVMRNAYAQTAVAPYALRPKPGAPVATPLEWDEVADSRLHSQRYNLKNVLQRVERSGDPWKSIWRHPQSLEESRRKLDEWIAKERRGAA